ncbi:MAG: SRPBCC family protein [Chloroflexota bacterium]|nr:SRPBCC family protein [Chloroflexota bacterium]
MIHTHNQISIDAPADAVFELAADIDRWPEFLAHYRYVREVPSSGKTRQVAMGAKRSGIPVRWEATQVTYPEERRIVYHHVAGVTQEMDVEWRIDPRQESCQVSISHDLRSRRWWLRNPIAEWIVGNLFVMHIADRTLMGIKRHAEERAGAPELSR